MAFRVPRLICANRILNKPTADIPKGHLAVYVGASQKKRYVIIPIGYIISEPPFVSRFVVSSPARIRFDHPMGGLTIPCLVEVFIDVTSRLSRN